MKSDGMAIGVVIANPIHGWHSLKGMNQEMSNAENVNTTRSESSAGTHIQSLWAMLSEHTVERCQNCGMWKHEGTPCSTCLLFDIRQKWVA